MINKIILSEKDSWILHEQLEAAAQLGVKLSELADEPDISIYDLDQDNEEEEE